MRYMKKYTFIPWLRRQIDRDDDTGLFAYTIFSKESVPVFDGRTRLALEQFMFAHLNNREAWKRFSDAIEEYKQYAIN